MTHVDPQRDDLIELEKRFWLEGGGNPAFWRHHFADHGLVVLPIGILDKDQTVQAMQQAQVWDEVDMQHVRVTELADTVMLVTYEAEATRPGSAAPYHAAVSSVYVRHADGWDLVFHQQSPTAAAGTN